MKFSKTAFDKAEAELSERRKRSEQQLEARRKYAYERMPELKILDKSMRNSYFELVQIVAKHDPNAEEAVRLVKKKNLATRQRYERLLKTLTSDSNYLKPQHICPKCGDSGFVEGIRCECFNDLLKKYTVQELNESSTIKLHDFSEFNENYYVAGENREQMKRFLAYVMNYCERFPLDRRSMLFMGQTGLGKTFLSSCIAKRIAERGYIVAIGSASDFLRKIENEHFGRAEGATLDMLTQADCLIIDDLGSEFTGTFYESTIYNIINNRINTNNPTIISTNLKSEQISKRYNERIASRILNEFTPFVFSGKDIRQQKSVI